MVKKKLIRKFAHVFSVIAIVIYTGLPRIMSVSSGLPYHHFWDEPISVTGALISMKTNNIFPNGAGNLVYGGGLRLPMTVIDYIYYQYLKISPKYDVEDKSDIKTYLEGVYKTTSHSGFYYWNRVFVVFISVLGFVFAFEIGRLRGGYTMGFIIVLLLSSIFIYYERSFLGNVDVPLSTWTLGAILFSLRFNKGKNIRDLYYSLICVGLAMGTKYTGALTFLIPLSAAILNYKTFGWTNKSQIAKSVLKWGGISFAVFGILNPVFIVFPDRFYKTITWIGMVYKTGQGHFEKSPGWEHLSYQISELANNYGPNLIYLALIGLIIGLIKFSSKKLWQSGTNTGFVIMVIFPCIYLVFVTFLYTIAYHRNFTLIYPILAILTAEMVISLIDFFTNRLPKPNKIKWAFGLMAFSLFFYISFPGYSGIFKLSKNTYESIETRTKSILEINAMADSNLNMFVGINEDFLFSPEDLRNLKVNFGYFNIEDLNNASLGFTHLLLPDYNSNLQISNFDSLKIHIQEFLEAKELKRIEGNKLDVQETLSDQSYPIYNPTVIITKGSEYPPPEMSKYKPPLERRDAAELISNSTVSIFTKRLEPGDYKLEFESKGSQALNIYPIFKVILENDTISTILTEETYTYHQVLFSISKNDLYHLSFRMINDYYDSEKGQDRNVLLKRIQLWNLANEETVEETEFNEAPNQE